MYVSYRIVSDGFRKVVNIEQSGLVKPERDDTEFQHLYFLQGHEHLLEHIKRKVWLTHGYTDIPFSVAHSHWFYWHAWHADSSSWFCVCVLYQVSIVKSEETKFRQEDLSKLLYEVQVLRSQQENMECQMQDMKQWEPQNFDIYCTWLEFAIIGGLRWWSRTQFADEALCLLVSLHPSPCLWSWGVGSNW